MMRAILVLAMIAAPGLASAQPMRNPDLDRDGKVTLDEFRRGQSVGMTRLDADKDGRLSKAEFDVALKRVAMFGASARSRMAAMWTTLDADRDGYVTRAEREANQHQRFRAADGNNDGWLSRDELRMMRQNMARGG